MTCEECGHKHERCAGHSKRNDGKPCTNWPVRGATVCRMHGAGKNTPARKKAQQRVALDKAKKVAAHRGLSREIDPHTALLEELWRSAGYVDFLDEAVNGSPSHAWWEALLDERKLKASIARDCIRAGIEERRQKLAEDQARALAAVITGILTDLGVMDRPDVPQIVRRRLLEAGEG